MWRYATRSKDVLKSFNRIALRFISPNVLKHSHTRRPNRLGGIAQLGSMTAARLQSRLLPHGGRTYPSSARVI
ncbi:unnamed protein product [Leptosia nina]|uniref:Ribosomal protein S14 n=1 Tax=Leptosia nina TaxID=320188 RepID=A0AAV1JMC6_9NEOP